MTTYEKLKQIIIEQLCVEPELVTPEKRFADDLGADSLDNIELLLGIEVDFGIDITDADAGRITTVAEAVALIDQLVARRAA